MPKTYFFTGGTGFLGSLLSAELIKRGDKIIFLGRRESEKSFQEQVFGTLKSINPDIPSDNIETAEINLNKKNLGLSNNYLDQFSGKIDGVWHLAANLSFKEQDRNEVFATNVEGVKNILDLARYLRIPVFHISTAYVHGQRSGMVFENELIRPGRFNNPYEESKFEGEKAIRKWGEDKNNQFIIFRPSILIEIQRKTVSFFGYYAVVYSLYKLKKKLGTSGKIFFPFPYSKKSFLNLMPIEIAVKWMLEISSNPRALGRTFHITNPAPFSMEDITKQTFKALDIKIPIFCSPKRFVRLYFSLIYFIGFLIKPLRSLGRKLHYYGYYMREYVIYDMKNTKEFLRSDIMRQFDFKHDFIQGIAEDFIKTINKLQ